MSILKALQYIYTSWKNGDSTEKGYMIYSHSLGISATECAAIKDAMQYMPPKELNPAPSQAEIESLFPYSFAYFTLPTGRKCVAQSTYLGKDYSGRFGNYIIFAMVFDTQDLECRPSELFGESYIKNVMTDDELNASSPVPPLPILNITSYGSIINDEQLSEFLFDKEDEFAQLISLALAAKDKGIPFFLNDTREHLVLWVAAIQRILPHKISLDFTFNTYMGNHEFIRSQKAKDEGLNFCLVGVRPDANYFNYSSECFSNKQIVMDFVGGYMTDGIPTGTYAQAMASSIATDYEEIDNFSRFLEKTTFSCFQGCLQAAYDYYRLLIYGEFEFSGEKITSILNFGNQYCSEQMNSEFGSKLLSMEDAAEWIFTEDNITVFWTFCCNYTGFMIYSLYEILQDTIYRITCDATDDCSHLCEVLLNIKATTPKEYNDFLSFENSPQVIDQLVLYLDGHTNIYTNEFYMKWILTNYTFLNGLGDRQPINKLIRVLMNNIIRIKESEINILQILAYVIDKKTLFTDMLIFFIKSTIRNGNTSRVCDAYIESLNSFGVANRTCFEQVLLEHPDLHQFAIALFTKQIERSKNPDGDFWLFYEQLKNLAKKVMPPEISPMIKSFLQNLNEKERRKNILRMIYNMDDIFYKNETTMNTLLEAINSLDIKSLIEIDNKYLNKIYQCYKKTDGTSSNYFKLKSLVIANEVSYARLEPNALSKIYTTNTDLALSSFEKSDYITYVNNYSKRYFSLLESQCDVECLVKIFYHNTAYEKFVKKFIEYLKEIQKKENKLWINLLIWVSVYITSNAKTDSAIAGLYMPVIRYMKELDEGDLLNIEHELSAIISRYQLESFFEDIRRKEGIYERLTGLFHKK